MYNQPKSKRGTLFNNLIIIIPMVTVTELLVLFSCFYILIIIIYSIVIYICLSINLLKYPYIVYMFLYLYIFTSYYITVNQ